jgi:hypothetical protein
MVASLKEMKEINPASTISYIVAEAPKTRSKGQKRRNYTQEDVNRAYEAYVSGKVPSIRQASIIFGVPNTTLSDKIRGNSIFMNIRLFF